ncbi:hypothetical protein [Bradyrhizobium oligotrophicum]|uniref:hypothetical protein n=1 Tax=Bradyrhizobium oligotrophicum TaxID=44255 RepID=UPI003EBA58BF
MASSIRASTPGSLRRIIDALSKVRVLGAQTFVDTPPESLMPVKDGRDAPISFREMSDDAGCD